MQLAHPSPSGMHQSSAPSYMPKGSQIGWHSNRKKIRGTINIVNNILRYPLTLKIHHQQQLHLSSCSRRLRTPFRLAQPRRRSYPETDKSKQQGPSF